MVFIICTGCCGNPANALGYCKDFEKTQEICEKLGAFWEIAEDAPPEVPEIETAMKNWL